MPHHSLREYHFTILKVWINQQIEGTAIFSQVMTTQTSLTKYLTTYGPQVNKFCFRL